MTLWERLLGRANRITNDKTSILVEYRPQTGSTFELRCNFWSSYYEMDDSGVPVQQHEPKLGVILADFQNSPVQGDHVFIGGDLFVVSSVETDDAYRTAEIFLHKC